jgi:hypothetical protein
VIHSALAVSVMRGVSLVSFIGPGVSARYSCMPPTPSTGRIATASTMMPMPPNHCVCCRYHSSECGSVSSPTSHGRPSGGEAGDGLEHRVCEAHDGDLDEQQRHSPREAQHAPEAGDHEEAVADAQLGTVTAQRQEQREPRARDDEEGLHERQPYAVVVDPGHDRRRQHRDAEQRQQQPEDPQDDETVHRARIAIRCRSRSPGTASPRPGSGCDR